MPRRKHKNHPIVDALIVTLVSRRHDFELSQMTLEAMIGCSRNWVAKAESGLRTPSLASFVNWADALGCDLRITGNPIPQSLHSDAQFYAALEAHGLRLTITPRATPNAIIPGAS